MLYFPKKCVYDNRGVEFVKFVENEHNKHNKNHGGVEMKKVILGLSLGVVAVLVCGLAYAITSSLGGARGSTVPDASGRIDGNANVVRGRNDRMDAAGETEEKRNFNIEGRRTIRRDGKGRELGYTDTFFTEYVAPDGTQVHIDSTIKVTFGRCPDTGIITRTSQESWSSAAEGQETTTEITINEWNSKGQEIEKTLYITVTKADGTRVTGTEVQRNIIRDANGEVTGYDFERFGDLFE